MSILGIIAEYNPFHNGHLYHLQTAKKLTSAEAVICIMSGNFTQRGEPTIVDKWLRTEIALKEGADLVIELPFAYAVRSAGEFAYGSVELLNATGLVDYLCFGSENGRLDLIQAVSNIWHNETPQFKDAIAKELSTGESFPAARAKATRYILENSQTNYSDDELAQITQQPNNVLGIAYLRALEETKSSITPINIKREGSGYNEQSLNTASYSSATSIRMQITKNRLQNQTNFFPELSMALPKYSYNLLASHFDEKKTKPVYLEDFAPIIIAKLRQTSAKDLKNFLDITEGLENRLKDAAKATTVLQVIEALKTKRYTWTRLQRILTYIMLGMTKDNAAKFKDAKGPQYLRILGFSAKGRTLLQKMRKTAQLPIIMRVAPFLYDNATSKIAKEMLEFDIMASDIYNIPLMQPGGTDFTHPMIRVDRNNA